MRFNFKSFILGILLSVAFLAIAVTGALADRFFDIKPLDYLVERTEDTLNLGSIERKILTEESAVIDVAEKVSPSVVTVAIETPSRRVLEFNPFEGFSSRIEGGTPQDIGSGFIVSSDGLIITNKHVVSQENAEYKVVTKDGNEYPVEEIKKDPVNDVAIIRINASGLKPVELGDSENLKVGQFVIAIGTALGEFRHTVTTGVISGLGRGIVAGSAFEGYVERLDDVIQTDAAINPGNSGGPLLNSAGQVIGVNVAVAQGAENIGFAIPIKVVKEGLDQFNKTGQFASKPFLGVRYQMISMQTAILNDVPQGAYVVDVVAGSPAQSAGIEIDDIITEFNGQKVDDSENGLANEIGKYKAGDRVKIKLWRNGETLEVEATLSDSSE